MPRKPRIEFSGAFYHVIVRGNQKQRVFKDAADFQKYLLTLTVYKNRTGNRIYAYILMNNHVHLLIETEDIPLSKVMQGVNQTYTMYFNRKYRTVGHLFQGRYKAILCDRDAYLLGLVQYIHRNPLRAKIADRLDDYPWSSHHAYTGKNNPLALVDVDQVLRMFSEKKARARMKYRELMAEKNGFERKEVYAAIDQRLKGDDEFVDRILELHDKPAQSARQRKIPLEAIARKTAQHYGLDLANMISTSRAQTLAEARKVFSFIARDEGYKAKEIAGFLRKDATLVSVYLRDTGGVDAEVRSVKALLVNISSFQA
ncbi:MAG: transposase [Nitrospirota bacterium]